MHFKYKNLNNIDLSIDLPIKEAEFNAIKLKVNKSKLEDLDYWEFWDIRDFLFKELIINIFENSLLLFFENIHLNNFIVDDTIDNLEIKIVDVFYHFYYGEEIFLFSEPSSFFYPNYNVERLETRLKYNTKELEYLLEQVLDAFGVDYSYLEIEGSDLSSDELDLGGIFKDLVFKCWSKVKFKLKLDVIGMLTYATGGICVDLDNGNEIEQTNEGIELYIKDKKN